MSCPDAPAEIGELRHPIEIQEKILTSDGSGGQIITWETKATIYAKVKQMNSYETYKHLKIEWEEAVKFIFLYYPDLEPTDRILFRDNYYNIKTIDNVNYNNIWHTVIALNEVAQ